MCHICEKRPKDDYLHDPHSHTWKQIKFVRISIIVYDLPQKIFKQSTNFVINKHHSLPYYNKMNRWCL